MGSYNSTVYLDLRLSKGSADAVLASLGKQAEELGDKIDALKAKWANMTPQQIQDSGRQKEYDQDMKEIKRMLDDQRRLARAMQQDIKGLDLISKALEKNMKLTAQQSDQALREVRKRIKALGDDMSDEAQRELNMWKHIETELQNKSKSISAGFVSVFDEARKVIKTYRESSHEEMNKMAEDTEKHEQRVRDAAAKTMQAKKEASEADRKLNEATEKRQANAEKKQHAEQVIKTKKAQGVKLDKDDTVDSLTKQVEEARKAKQETERQMKAIAKNRGVEQKVADAKQWQENMNREQRYKKSLEQAGAQPGVRILPGGSAAQNAETPAEHQADNDLQVMSEQDKIKAEWQKLNKQEADWIKDKQKKQLSAIQQDYDTATARRDELQGKLPAGYAQKFAQAKADKDKADRLIMAIAETRGTEYIDENGNKVKGRGVAVDAALRGVRSKLQEYDTSKVEGEARVEMERKQAENAAEIARLRDIQEHMTSGSDYSLVERLDTDFEKARKAMLERAGELESLKALKESGSGNAALEDRISDVIKEIGDRQKTIADLTKKITAAGATGEELVYGINPELAILNKARASVSAKSKSHKSSSKEKREAKALLEKILARIGQIQSGDLSGDMVELKASDFADGGDKMVKRLAEIKEGRSNYAEQIRELQGKQAEQNAELVKLKAGEIVVADYEGMTPEELDSKIAEAKAASDKAKSDFETIKKQRAAKGNKAGQDSIEARIRGLQAQNDVYDRRLSDDGRELTAEEKNKKRQLEERQARLEEDQRLLQAEGIDTSKMVSNEDNERIRKRSKDAKELMEKNALTKKEQHELDTLLGQISGLEWALAHEGIQVQESRRARIEQTLKDFRDKKKKFLEDHNLTEEQMLAMMGMAPEAPAASGSSAHGAGAASGGAAPASAGTQYEHKTVKPETKIEKRRVKVGARKVAAAGGGTGSNALIEAYKGYEQQMTDLNKKIEDNLAAQEEAMFADPDSLTALTEEQDKLGEQSQDIIAKMNDALAGLEALGVKFSDDASKRYKVISDIAGVASGSAMEIEEDVFEEKDVLMYKDADGKWKEAKNGVVPDIKVKVPKAQAPTVPAAPVAQAPIQASSVTVQTSGDANVQAADDVNVGGEKPVSVEFKATPEEVAEALAEIQKDGETYLHGHGTGSTPGGVDPNEFFRTGLRVPHGDVSETTIPLSNEAGEISGKLSNWGHNDSKQVVIIPAKSAGVVFGPDGTRTPLDMFGDGSFQYKEEQVGTGILAHMVSGYSPVYQNGQNAVWTKPEAPLGVYDSERGVFTASNINQYYEPYRGEDGKLHFRARGEQSVPSSSSTPTASVSHLESVLKAVEGTREKGSIDEQVKWQELHVKALQHSKELDKSEEEYAQEQAELLDQYNAKRSAVIVSMSSEGLKGKDKEKMDAVIETMKEFGFGTENIGAGVAKQMQDKVNSLKQKMKETTDETEKGNIKKEVDRIEAAKKLLNGKIDEQLTPSDKWLKTRVGWIAELLKNSKTEQTDDDRKKLTKEQDKLDELRDLVKEVNDITLGGIATDEQIAAVKKMVEDAKAEKAKQAEKPAHAPKKEEKKEEAPADPTAEAPTTPATVPSISSEGKKEEKPAEKPAEQKKRGRKPKDNRTVEQKIIDDVNNGFELDAMKYVAEGEEMTEQSAVALSNSTTATREQMLDLQGYTDRLDKAIDATKKALEIAENNIEMKKDADRRIAEAAAKPSEAVKRMQEVRARKKAAEKAAEDSGAHEFQTALASQYGGGNIYEAEPSEKLAAAQRSLTNYRESKLYPEQIEQLQSDKALVDAVKDKVQEVVNQTAMELNVAEDQIKATSDLVMSENFKDIRNYDKKQQEINRIQEAIDIKGGNDADASGTAITYLDQALKEKKEELRKYEKGSEEYNRLTEEIANIQNNISTVGTLSLRELLQSKIAERDAIMSEAQAEAKRATLKMNQDIYNVQVARRDKIVDEANVRVTRDLFMPQAFDLEAFAKEHGLEEDGKAIKNKLDSASHDIDMYTESYTKLVDEEMDITGKSDEEILEMLRVRVEQVTAAKQLVDDAHARYKKYSEQMWEYNNTLMDLWREERGDDGLQITAEQAKRTGLDVIATNLANGSVSAFRRGGAGVSANYRMGQGRIPTVLDTLSSTSDAIGGLLETGSDYSEEEERRLMQKVEDAKAEVKKSRTETHSSIIEQMLQQEETWKKLGYTPEQAREFLRLLAEEQEANFELQQAQYDAVVSSRGISERTKEIAERQRADNEKYDAIKNLQNEILGEEAASAARAGIAEAQSNWVGTNTKIANDFYYYGGQKSTIKRRYSAAPGEEMHSNGSVTIDNAPVRYAEEYIHDNAADKGSQIRAFVDRIKSGVTSDKMPAWAKQMTAEMSDNDKRTLIEALDTMTEKAVLYVQSLRSNAEFNFEAQQAAAFEALDAEQDRVAAAKAANPKGNYRVRKQFQDAVTDEAIVAKVNSNLEKHLANLSKDPKKFMEAFGFTEDFIQQLLESGMTPNNILQLKTAMADIISQPAATLVGTETQGYVGNGQVRRGKTFKIGEDGKREQLPIDPFETQGQVKLLPTEVLDKQALDVFLQNLAHGIITEGNTIRGSKQGYSVGYDSETSATKDPNVIDAWNQFLRENGFVDYSRDRQPKPGDRTYIGQDYEGDKKTEEEWKQEAIARQQKFNDELFGYFTIFDKETKKEIGRFSRVWGDTGMSDYENWSQDRKDALNKQLRGTGYSIDKIGLKTTSAGKATDEQRHKFYRLSAERKANLQVSNKEEDNWYMHSADKMENLEDRRERIEAHLNHLLELQQQLVAMPFENPKNSEEAQANMEHLLNTFLRYKEEREAMNALRMARAEDPTQTSAHKKAETRIKSAEAIKSDVDLIMEEDKTIKPNSSGQIKHTKAYLEALDRVKSASGQWKDYLTLRKEIEADAKDIQKFEEENKNLASRNAQAVQRQAVPLFDYLRSLTTYETGEKNASGENKLKKGLIDQRIGSIKDHKDTTGVGKTNVQFGYSAFNAAIESMNTKIMQALNSAELQGNDELKDQLVKKLIDFKTSFQQKVEAIIGDGKGQGGMTDDRKLDSALKGLVSEMNTFETGITEEVKLNVKTVSTARYAEAKERKRTNEARIQSMEAKLTEDKTMVSLNHQKALENVQTLMAQGGKTVGLASDEQMGAVLREIFDKLMGQIDHIDGMDPEFKKRFEEAVTRYLESIAASDTADAVGAKGQIGNTAANEQKAGAKVDELVRSRREQVMANNPTEETIKWATEIGDKQKQMLATEKEIQRLKDEGERKNYQEILDLEDKKKLQEQELADLEAKLELAQAHAEGRSAKVNKGELEQKEQAAAEDAAEKNETLKEVSAAEQDARDEQDEFYRELGDRRVYRADRLKEMYQQMMAEIDSASLTPEEHKAMAQEIATIKQIYNELIGNIAADLERIGSIEGPVLEQMRKHFQEVINDVDSAPESFEAAHKALASIAARDSQITTGGNRFSNDEVKDAIHNLQEYVKTAKLTDKERQKFVADIAQGNLYLEEMSKKDAITQMNEQFKGLRPEATETYRAMEVAANNARDAAIDYDNMVKKLKADIEEIDNEEMSTAWNSGDEDYFNEVQARREGKLRMIDSYENKSRKARAEEADNRQKMNQMFYEYEDPNHTNIISLSKDALQKQKEFWENEIRLGHEAAEGAMEYADRVKLLNDELTHRNDLYTAEEALDAAKNVGRAKFDAVKMRPSWKKGLFENFSDEALINETVRKNPQIKKDIENRRLKLIQDRETAESNGDFDEVGRINEQVDEIDKKIKVINNSSTGILVQPLKASYQELLKIKESLIEARKHLDGSIGNNDDEGRKKLLEFDQAIKDIDFDIKAAETDMQNIPDIIEKLQSKSPEELKKAAEQLKSQLESMSEDDEGRTEMVESYKEINEQISFMNEQMQEHKSQWDQAISRLKTYVMVYMSFNKAMDLMKQVFNNTMQLSDQMTNVSKVTNLTDEAVVKLTNSLMDLNTRTDLSNLMQLAEQGGKLGIALGGGEQALVSFVKAGEQIVNTLGDIGGAEAVTELLKVNDLVNKSSELLLQNGQAVRDMGINESLMRTGSAILNIGNNSKASYAKVSDFTRQMGAIGSAAKLSMPEIMALGGTIDALGGDISASSTAVSKIVMGLRSNTQDVARAAGISAKQLKEALDMGDTMGAFTQVLEGIKRNGTDITAVLKAMGGRQNVQAKTTLTLLVNNLDSLNYQLMLAKEGFEDGTMVESEFEKANNNLAGTVEQIKNEFREMTSSAEGSNGAMLTMSQIVLSLVRAFNNMGGIGLAITAMLVHQTTVMLASAAATWKHVTAHKALHAHETNILKIGATFLAYLWNKTLALLGNANAANKAAAAMTNLKRASAASWIGAILTVIVSVVYALSSWESKAAKAAKRMQELQQAGEDEVATLTRLYTKIKNTNIEQERRTELINQFNKQFGSYIGHLITETTQADMLASAYHKAAAAIKEKNAASIEEEASKTAFGNHKDEYKKYRSGMVKSLSGSQSDNDSATSDVLGALRLYLEENPNLTDDELVDKLRGEFGGDERLQSSSRSLNEYGPGSNSGIKNVFDRTWTSSSNTFIRNLKDYAQSLRDEQAEYDEASGVARDFKTAAKKDKKTSLQKLGSAIFATHKNEEGKTVDDLTDEEKLLQLYDYMRDMKALAGTYTEEDEKADTTHKQGTINVEKALGYDQNFSNLQAKIDPLVRSTSVWGKSAGNWESMGGEELKEVIDWYEYIVKWITGRGKSDAVDVNAKNDSTITATRVREAFLDDAEHGMVLPEGIENWSVQAIKEWAYGQATKARAVQDKNNNMNRNASFRWNNNSGSKHDPLDELMDKYLKKLEDFYNRQKDLIRENYEGQMGMEEVMERELQIMDQKYYAARVGLEAEFAGKQSALSEARLNQFRQMTRNELEAMEERKQTLLNFLHGEREEMLKASDFAGMSLGTLERTRKEKVVVAGKEKENETETLLDQMAKMFNEVPTRVWDIETLKKQMVHMNALGENDYKELADYVNSLNAEKQQKFVDLLNQQRQALTEKQGGKKVAVASADREQYLMDQLLFNLELTPEQAAGIVGNISFESKFDPKAYNAKSGATGLAQWLTPRKADFKDFAGKALMDATYEEQVAFIIHELKGKEADALKKIQKATSVRQASDFTDQYYERSEGTTRTGRANRASSALKNYNNRPDVGEGGVITRTLFSGDDLVPGMKDMLTVWEEKQEREIEIVNETETRKLQDVFLKMLSENPTDKWDVASLKAAAQKTGGDVASHIASLKEYQLNELVDRLNYLQTMSIEDARAELDKLNQRENNIFSIEDYGFGPEYERDLQIIQHQLALNDSKHEKKLSELLANTSKDLLTYRKELAEHFHEIHKTLLEGKPLEKAVDDFRAAMTKLGLVFTDEEMLENATKLHEQVEAEMKRRMDIFTAYAAQITTLTEEEFVSQISITEGFVGRTTEEYAVMYQQLLQYRDDYDEAARKQAKQSLKLLTNRVESGEYYAQQLASLRKYQEELVKAKKTGTEAYAAVARAIDVVAQKQNQMVNGKRTTYQQRLKQNVESANTRVKMEESVKNTGVNNGVQLGQARVRAARAEFQQQMEQYQIRQALAQETRMDAMKAFENAQVALEQTQKGTKAYEDAALALGVAYRDLQTAEVKATELIGDSYEKMLEKQTALVEKEAEVMSERINNVKEFQESFKEAISKFALANIEAYEAKAFELAELRAKKELGLVQDTARQRYLIIKKNGEYETRWLNQEEYLRTQQEIDANNKRAEALAEGLKNFAERVNKQMRDVFLRRFQLDEEEEKERERQAMLQRVQNDSLVIQHKREHEFTLMMQSEWEARLQAARAYADFVNNQMFGIAPSKAQGASRSSGSNGSTTNNTTNNTSTTTTTNNTSNVTNVYNNVYNDNVLDQGNGKVTIYLPKDLNDALTNISNGKKVNDELMDRLCKELGTTVDGINALIPQLKNGAARIANSSAYNMSQLDVVGKKSAPQPLQAGSVVAPQENIGVVPEMEWSKMFQRALMEIDLGGTIFEAISNAEDGIFDKEAWKSVGISLGMQMATATSAVLVNKLTEWMTNKIYGKNVEAKWGSQATGEQRKAAIRSAKSNMDVQVQQATDKRRQAVADLKLNRDVYGEQSGEYKEAQKNLQQAQVSESVAKEYERQYLKIMKQYADAANEAQKAMKAASEKEYDAKRKAYEEAAGKTITVYDMKRAIDATAETMAKKYGKDFDSEGYKTSAKAEIDNKFAPKTEAPAEKPANAQQTASNTQPVSGMDLVKDRLSVINPEVDVDPVVQAQRDSISAGHSDADKIVSAIQGKDVKLNSEETAQAHKERVTDAEGKMWDEITQGEEWQSLSPELQDKDLMTQTMTEIGESDEYGQYADMAASDDPEVQAQAEQLKADMMLAVWERYYEQLAQLKQDSLDTAIEQGDTEMQASLEVQKTEIQGKQQTVKESIKNRNEDLQNQKKTNSAMIAAAGAKETAMQGLNEATAMGSQALGGMVAQATGSQMLGDLTATVAQAGAKAVIGIATGTAQSATEGWWMPAIVQPILTSILMGLLGMATSKAKSAESTIAQATGAKAGRLTTGMLTYATGRYLDDEELKKGRITSGMMTMADGYQPGQSYNVDGADGKSYNAKYAGSVSDMGTGLVRGTHFGIFSEVKPETVIDGDTTAIIHNKYPFLENAWLQIARTGSLNMQEMLGLDYASIGRTIDTLSRSGAFSGIPRIGGMRMPTFASGNYPYDDSNTRDFDVSMTRDFEGAGAANMQADIDSRNRLAAAIEAMVTQGISANINSAQASKALARQKRFEARNGISNGLNG